MDRLARRVLFTANRDGVLDRQLYAVSLSGGAVQRLSQQPGVHTVYGRHAEYGWVDVHSALDRLPRAVIHKADGSQAGLLPVREDGDLATLNLRSPQLVKIVTDGKPDLHGALLQPRRLVSGTRYPAIIMVYGGPAAQMVSNKWKPKLLWQHLADRGFVVFQVDNRGSAGRGHRFEAALYGKLGEVELADQLRAVQYLSEQSYVDPQRIGIFGHSYGGFLTVRAMLAAPQRFKVGVAAAPVTDWRLYDSGYTERYMGLPGCNPSGYDRADLVPLAGRLSGKLLLVHALMDENVHFQHTTRLIDAFIAADKDFDLLVLPGQRHGFRGRKARRYVYRRAAEYFATHL